MPVQRSTTTGRGPGGRSPQRELQQHLGLGARHEDAGAHGHLDRTEHGGAEQVLQGLTGDAARDEGLEHRTLRLVRRVGEQQTPARDAQDVGDEQLGVDARGGDAGLGEPGGRPGNGVHGAHGAQERGSSAVRAIRSARSAERRASSTASRSPSSTRSRSCDL